MTVPLEPDRAQIEQFVDAVFRHVAGAGGYIFMRSYIENDTKDDKAFRITPVRLNGKGLQFLIDVAVDDARRAAQDPKPVVFCPPMAVFSNKDQAREADLTHGPALSVEIDENPREGVARLTAIIGQATAVVSVIGHKDREGPLRDYCTGLMMPCERKSVEPMAAVTAPARVAAQHQSLLHFVGAGGWSGRGRAAEADAA